MSKTKYIILITILVITTIIYIVNFDKTKKAIDDNQPKIMKVNKNIVSIMLETDNGNYEKSTSSNWPTEGYVFNSELSRCENGGELSWDDENKKVLMTGNTSDKCYIYFDKVVKAVINEVVANDITTTSLTITISATKGTYDINKYYYSINDGTTWNESTNNVITISSLTKGTTYVIKIYVQDEKKNNSEYKSINVSTLNVSLISFTIDSTTYYAEENMTWREWTESTYSNNEFYCVETIVTDKASSGNKRITYYTSEGLRGNPLPDDKITENQDYFLLESHEPV